MKKLLATANSAGDLCALDPIGAPLTNVVLFEFKRGYGGSGKKKTKKKDKSREVGILPIIDNPPSQQTPPVLLQWFTKAERERADHKRLYTFIIFKRDRKIEVISMTRQTYDYIKHRLDVKYGIIGKEPKPLIDISCKGFSLVAMRLNDFFVWCNPGIFKGRILRRRKRG
jgi:hypothetical protein